MKIYIPSYLGDVKIESDGKKTIITYKALTDGERQRLKKFLVTCSKPLGDKDEGIVVVDEPISTVHKRFVKIFKIGKPTINAIKVTGDKIEMVQEFPEYKNDLVGVTTEKPPRGCPVPRWEMAENRAMAVINEFLNPAQKEDFARNRQFISIGNYSGNPYLLTSRWNPLVGVYGLLYSIPGKNRICTSMPDLPPSEELLALKIVIECDEKNFVGMN